MKSFDNLNNWREEFLIQVVLMFFKYILLLATEEGYYDETSFWNMDVTMSSCSFTAG